MLIAGRIHRYDLERIERIFFQLDKDGSAELNSDDLLDLVQFQKERRELHEKQARLPHPHMNTETATC